MTGIAGLSGDLAGPESILGPVGLMGEPDEKSKKGDKDKEEEENGASEEGSFIAMSPLSNDGGTIDEPRHQRERNPVTSRSDLTVTDEPGRKPK